MLLFLLLKSLENTRFLLTYLTLCPIQHFIGRHISVENVADGQTASVVFYLNSIPLHNIMFFPHAGILILIRDDFILNLTKFLIKVVDLITHALDVLHYVICLLFFLFVLFLRVYELFSLVLLVLPRFLEFVRVSLHKVL